jgi:hypothetical protein
LRAQDAPKSPASGITDEGLRTMLDNMGYVPKNLSKGYLIAISRDSWTFNIQLLLSDDNTKIGFNSNLGIVENPDSVTAQQWKELLIGSGEIDPSFFYLAKDAKKLFLHRVLDNRGIDAAFLRQQIESFCTSIKSTSKLWNFTK